MTENPKQTGRAARRRRNRRRRSERAALYDLALLELGMWREQAPSWIERAEAKGTANLTELQFRALCQLGPEQERDRMAMIQCRALPITEATAHCLFLGMNLYGWMHASDELLKVFDLLSAATLWREQAADVGMWPPRHLIDCQPTSPTIH